MRRSRDKKTIGKRSNRKRRKEKLKIYMQGYKRNNPCVDCGESDITILEFDHVRGKKSGNVGDILHRCGTWKKLFEEIAKCEIRCTRCHSLRHEHE